MVLMNNKNYENPQFDKCLNATPFIFQFEESAYDPLKPYRNEYLEIRYLISGEYDFYCDSNLYHANAEDVIIINPFERYVSKVNNLANIKYNSLLVNITEKYTGFLFQKYFAPFVLGEQKFVNVISDIDVKKIVIELFNGFISGKAFSEIEAYEKFLRLIELLRCSHIQENQPNKSSDRLIKHKEIVNLALDYIYEHYADQVTLTSIAKSCYVTEAHLCRIFKNDTGKSPINYLIDFRVKKSVALLADFDLSISEVSKKCGFTDVSYFSKCFKKTMKMSPSDYVKNVLKENKVNEQEKKTLKKIKYLDIMEKVLDCYSVEKIISYYESVKHEGWREHGFPRVVANIGVLLAHGRCERYKPLFCEMMTFCCKSIPNNKMTSRDAGNDFIVREICLCIDLIKEKKIVDESVIDEWIGYLREIDPKTIYTCVAQSPDDNLNNWAIFAGLSELARNKICGVSTEDFIEMQFASQIKYFDENGMYKDPGCPLVYDYISRLLFDFALFYGYNGKYKSIIQDYTNKASKKAILFQSVTGEMPYGGRSMQCLHNEMWLAADFEYHATRLKYINPALAGRFKMAAQLAYENMLWSLEHYNSHVKNCYPPIKNYGCESYAYFDKYMVTAASAAYMAYLLADDEIEPSQLREKYCVSPTKNFHKIFVKAFDWFVEIDTDADYHYDANGIGRIHKKDCPPTIALSVPFPGKEALYYTENKNSVPMSLCCFVERGKKTFYGSVFEPNGSATMETKDCISVLFERRMGDIDFEETYTVTKDSLVLSHNAGENAGFMLPVISFDGKNYSLITQTKSEISVKYMNHICTYSFVGRIAEDYNFYNRNGEYKVYKVYTDSVTITML